MWQSTTKDFVQVIKNNNVLIKEIIAGLIQPEWVQRPWGSSPMGPEQDSRVFMLRSSARPATKRPHRRPSVFSFSLADWGHREKAINLTYLCLLTSENPILLLVRKRKRERVFPLPLLLLLLVRSQQTKKTHTHTHTHTH